MKNIEWTYLMPSTTNNTKYIQQYNKEHYKTFKVDLKKEEFEQLEKKLKDNKLTKAQFLRDAIKKLG